MKGKDKMKRKVNFQKMQSHCLIQEPWGLIHKKVENPKNMLLIKNPQFLSDFAQTFRD